MARNRQNSARKKAMLEALEKSMGIVTTASKAVGIDRQTHYNWMKEDEQYAEAVSSLEDIVLDFAESSLYKQVKEGNPTSTIFLLKTKGKRRGYIEKTQVELSGKVDSSLKEMTNEQLDALINANISRKGNED